MAPGMRVGVFISTSGPLYFAGAFQKAAAELAKKDLAKLVNLELIFQDAGNTELAAEFGLRAIQKRPLDLVLLPIETDSVKRVLKSKLLSDVILVAPSVIDENLVGGKQILRMASTQSQDSYALAKFVAKQNNDTVAVVSASDEYSKSVAKSISFALSMRAVRVKNHVFNEGQALREIKAEALVLASMEQSAELLAKLPNWLDKFRRIYLVPGNLANYSGFPFAADLAQATGLLALEEHSQGFRQRLAAQMGRSEILKAPNSPMFGLAWRTYQALVLAGEQIREVGDLSELANVGLFNPDGFYLGQRYSVIRYSNTGVYSIVGSFDPKLP